MWIDSLGAFYPGLLALAGEVDEAIEANLVYTALWTRYAALPERWSIRESNVEAGIGWWPGRPEFIESTYHIYRATRDPWYLHVGEMVLKDIKRRCHAPCGWAGLQDVRTGEKQDRMESFFLGETTKYMYLLFDLDHPLNKLDAAYVFTTEGHPLILPKERFKPPRKHFAHVSKSGAYSAQHFTNTCPLAPPPENPLTGSLTAARPQLFEASLLTGLHRTPNIHGPVDVVEVEDKSRGRLVMHRAASNHSLFPWTLPPTMLPPNGTCVATTRRVMTAIEFPATDAASALASKLGASVVWYNYAGPTVKVLDGLKLQMQKEHSSELQQDVWRITHVGTTELGRHETVFFYAEHVEHFKDEAFTCKRRLDAVDIHFLVQVDHGANASTPLPTDDAMTAHSALFDKKTDKDAASEKRKDAASQSLLHHLLRAVSSVFEPAHTHTPAAAAEPDPVPLLLSFYAHTATGPGAVPLPSIGDTPLPGSPLYQAAQPGANFPWTSIYLAGYACDGPLADAVPRQHHVIVMRRGRCPFSRKLDSIPSFVPGPLALQLVVMVDDAQGPAADDDGVDDKDDVAVRLNHLLDRPLLGQEQRTPRGSPRLHGVPMVLMRGVSGDYHRLGTALAAGMRRKYILESQGLLIANGLVM
ncbi:hypothetical protein CDD82_2311 [Ophiocordyceps australis]|uniref:alpha-1,2-Mannosidase n=1 Tax=Ophiocordyceps australis TaxID=1399860 RepID=A0A2C5XF59_9HYPO|nr:hypothetical protein CDD82_2311 [Ophiocordyceps australis]